MSMSFASITTASLLPYFPAAPHSSPATAAGLAPWQVRIVVDTMLEQLAAKISTSALARECGLSRGHFSRAFKKTFGLPPHSWRQMQRIALAKSMLLDSRDPLADIAVHCGFSDQAHFTRAFKAATGSTPLAWRRSGRAKPALVAVRHAGRVDLAQHA